MMATKYPSIVQTRAVQEALQMADSVMQAASFGAIGAIVGPPGVGKTAIGHALVEHRDAIRVCAHIGITTRHLVARVQAALGMPPTTGGAGTLLAKMASEVRGRLIVVDEANTLTWRELETLRFISDEMETGLVLVGTELLDRPFRDARTAILLSQLASRIGLKRLDVRPFETVDETAAYIITPLFGAVSASAARRFHEGTGGLWRQGIQLATGCQRIMQNEGASKLTREIVQAAIAVMRGRNPLRVVAGTETGVQQEGGITE